MELLELSADQEKTFTKLIYGKELSKLNKKTPFLQHNTGFQTVTPLQDAIYFLKTLYCFMLPDYFSQK